jgi:hypothetical protein
MSFFPEGTNRTRARDTGGNDRGVNKLKKAKNIKGIASRSPPTIPLIKRTLYEKIVESIKNEITQSMMDNVTHIYKKEDDREYLVYIMDSKVPHLAALLSLIKSTISKKTLLGKWIPVQDLARLVCKNKEWGPTPQLTEAKFRTKIQIKAVNSVHSQNPLNKIYRNPVSSGTLGHLLTKRRPNSYEMDICYNGMDPLTG